MIIEFYKNSPQKKQKITRRRCDVRPFIIPDQHFLNNHQNIKQLKAQCQKYESEFRFIQNQIQRQFHMKKQNNRHQQEIDKSKLKSLLVFNKKKKDRETRRKELGINLQLAGNIKKNKKSQEYVACQIVEKQRDSLIGNNENNRTSKKNVLQQ